MFHRLLQLPTNTVGHTLLHACSHRLERVDRIHWKVRHLRKQARSTGSASFKQASKPRGHQARSFARLNQSAVASLSFCSSTYTPRPSLRVRCRTPIGSRVESFKRQAAGSLSIPQAPFAASPELCGTLPRPLEPSLPSLARAIYHA